VNLKLEFEIEIVQKVKKHMKEAHGTDMLKEQIIQMSEL